MRTTMKGTAAMAWAVLSLGPLSGCATKATAGGPTSGTCGYDALVAVSDYASSGVGGFSLQDANFVTYGVDLGADPALSASNGRAFLVLRDVGHILELDPGCGTLRTDGGVFSANDPGATRTSNPQDVAAAPDGTLWVPRYDTADVLQIPTGGGVARTLSIAPYDPDGNPNATAIAIVPVSGVAKAFVALEVLNDKALPLPAPYPNLPSLVLRIDVATGAIEGTTSLEGRNPFGLFVPYGGALWLAEPGDFASTTEPSAGIERFDPATHTSALVAHETDLGGSVAEVAITSGCGAAIVADATSLNATSLVTFDPDTGTPFTTAKSPVLSTSGYDLQAMLWVGDVLLVGDRTQPASGGHYAVHAFDRTGGCVLRERPDSIFLGLPPVAFQPTD